MTVVVGIDPGLDGAVAILVDGAGPVFYRTPTLDCKGSKRTFDLPAMREILSRSSPSLVVIERVGARPGQGVTSMFNFGCGYGIWLGLLAGLGIPCEVVAVATWKKAILPGTAKDKTAAIELVSRRFPGTSLLATPRSKIPHDGFADACCLALYARILIYDP